MIQSSENLELTWKSHPTVRADLLTNREFSRTLIKVTIIFAVLLYCSQFLPNAHKVTSYIPQKWDKVDVLELHEVSPLNRYIKIYAMPANKSEDMDLIHQIDVFSLKDNQENQKKLSIRVSDMDQFVDISKGELRFYFGDLRVLDQVAYSIKFQKPLKVGARILQESSTNNNSTIVSQEVNSTQSGTVQGQTNQTLQQKEKQQQKKKEQQQNQRKRKQEQEQENKRKQQQKQKEEKRRQQQEAERQKIYDYTNINLSVEQMSSFGTVLELFTRYILVLVIIYISADNLEAPRSLPIICFIISNPLLFLQVSYPNKVSDVIDCICQSGPFLYIPLWVYYIHTHITFPDEAKHKFYLTIKVGLGVTLYILNVFRLLHYSVFFIQFVITIPVAFFLGSYLWEAFLDLHHQHHRDKVIIMTTLYYIVCLLTLKSFSAEWKQLISYVLHQMYGLSIIYLLGSPHKVSKKNKKVQQNPNVKIETVNFQEIKSEN